LCHNTQFNNFEAWIAANGSTPSIAGTKNPELQVYHPKKQFEQWILIGLRPIKIHCSNCIKAVLCTM
jgi:hypothetical protein